MSSIKQVKQELNSVVNNAVEEAYSFMLYNPGKKEKKAKEIIDEAANKKDELIAMINNRNDLSDSKSVKAHFSKIKSEIGDLKNKLSESIKKL